MQTYVHIFVYTGVHNYVLRTTAHFCVANVHKIVDECYVHIDVDINVYILCTFVTRVYCDGNVCESETVPDEWHHSISVSIYKGKASRSNTPIVSWQDVHACDHCSHQANTFSHEQSNRVC